jgi:hypothetical protein
MFLISFGLQCALAGLLLDYMIRGVSWYVKTGQVTSVMVSRSFPLIFFLVIISGLISVRTSQSINNDLCKISVGLMGVSAFGFVILRCLDTVA